jgi:pilus assembly protein Flp/PilA
MVLRRLCTSVIDRLWRLRIWADSHGQDLIEYALMAGFVATAAGALLPSVANSISVVFSKVAAAVDEASETGS